MKKKNFFLSIIVFFVFVSNSTAYQFTGTFSRWPTAQTKSIVTAIIDFNEYIFVGDGDTINVFHSTAFDIDFINYTRLPITKGEGILSLVYYEEQKTLYAACAGGGIHVIKVTDPYNPTIDGTSPVRTSVHLTERDEENGRTTSKINAFDLDIVSHFLFVADNDYGIRIFDLSSPGSPEDRNIAGRRLSDSSLRNIAIYKENQNAYHAVVLTNTAIMYFPLSIGSSTVNVQSVGTGTAIPSLAGASSLWVYDDGFAYCTDQLNNYLYIFNLSAAVPTAKPTLIYPTDGKNDLAFGQPRGLYIRGGNAYIASFYPDEDEPDAVAGLHIIDIRNKSLPLSDSNAVYHLDYANSIAVSGNFAYITSLKDGLHKIDISTPANLRENQANQTPPVIAPKPTRLNAADVFVAYEYAFVADKMAGDEFGFSIINVDNPYHPYFEKFVPTPGQAHEIYIDTDYRFGYVADGTEGIQVMTFGSGENQGLAEPEILGNSIETPDGVSAISISGSDAKPFLLAATDQPGAELWIIDVTDPLSPGLPTKVAVPEAKSVLAFESYAFVAAGSNGLKIFKTWEDKSIMPTPEAISILDETTYDDVTAVCTGTVTDDRTDSITGSSGNDNGDIKYAFIADSATGAQIIELFSDASNFSPKKVAAINTSEYGKAKDIAFSENHLYIMTDNNDHALLIYDVSDVNNPVLKDSTESNGTPSGLFVYDVTVEDIDADAVIIQKKIKSAYLAEGAAYLAIKEVSSAETSKPPRKWTNNSEMMCFLSTISHRLSTKTGLFPLFIFSVSCLILICFFSLGIRSKKKLRKINKTRS